MLKNPDIVPLASINRWILSILMFRFELVHVPGTHHGPDGLSRQQPQPDDIDEPEDNFKDWIDQVNEFKHFTNLVKHQQPKATKDSPVICYHNDVDRQQTPDDEQEEVEPEDQPRTEIGDYDDVPWTASLKTLDSRLQHMRNWLKSLD